MKNEKNRSNMCVLEPVSEKIKRIREQKNLTIGQLSAKCGVSEEVLEAIECDDNLPTTPLLAKIAKGLGIRVDTFSDESEVSGPVLTRKGDGVESKNYVNGHPFDSAYASYASLASGKVGRHMEPYILDVKPVAAGEEVSSAHEGEEFILVLDGSVDIVYGKREYTLMQGDSIYYDSIVSHSIKSHTEREAKVLAVLYSPVD